MKNILNNWKNLVSDRRSWWRRWRGVVTFMAMVVVFATTYALILPAITLEKEEGKPERGVYLENVERGSTASVTEEDEDLSGEDEKLGSEDSLNDNAPANEEKDQSDTSVFSSPEPDQENDGKSGQEESDKKNTADQKTAYANGVYTGTGDGYTLSLDLKEEMRLPADVTVSVEEIKEDRDTAAVYRSYMAAAKRAAAREGRGEFTSVRFIKFAFYSDGKEVRTNQDIDVLLVPMEKDKVRNEDETHVMTFQGSAVHMVEDVTTQMSGFRVSAYRFFYPSVTVDNRNWGLLCLAVTEPKAEGDELLDEDSAQTEEDGDLSEEMASSTEELSSTEEKSAAEEDSQEKTAAEENATEETVAEDNTAEENDNDEAATKAENDNRKLVEKLEFQGEDYNVVMTCDEKAGIPEGAVLQVTEIRKDSEEYDKYLKEASKTLEMNKMANPSARFFDIKIMDGDQEIEPKAPVSVSITYDQAMEVKEGEKVDALHFGEKETEVLEEVEVRTNRNDDVKSVTFDADSFSVYGVLAYTVDFTFDGYTYSIEGDSTVKLSKIIEVLGIAGEGKDYETGTDFVKDVKDVTFTDETLVKVEKAGLFGTGVFSGGDWELVSLKPFDTEETLTIEMEDGIRYEIKVTDDQIKANVLTADGNNYEITVSYGKDALIPDGAELRVREITAEDKDYAKTRSDIEASLPASEGIQPVNPMLFDISIWDGEKEIEPKEGSKVKVEIKLVSSALKGQFSDEDTPLLINDAPIQLENGYIERNIQVIHKANNGNVDVMDTLDNITAEEAMASFTTDSFSNWLVFLDESTKEITVGPGDIITLRPYNEWSWDEPSEQGDNWTDPRTNSAVTSAATVTPHTVTDTNLNHTYTFYDLKIKNDAAGKEFDVVTDGGRTIHIKVASTSPEQPTPPTVSTVTNADEGITFNLYDYDKSGNLDESNNKAEFWSSRTQNDQDNNRYEKGTVNEGHALKFLGWGYSGKYNAGWRGNWASGGILDYTGTTVSPGIVKSDLKEYTLDNGSKILVPELADFNEDLGYLFDTDSTWTNTGNRVQAYANADGLFQKGSNGYYYYNSNSNYAYFNGNEFEVYEHTYQQHTAKNDGGNGKPIGFFPFHEYEPDKDTDGTYGEGKQWMNHNKYLNHHFGMDMAVDFEIPADGLDEYGNPITFEFSGDDDLWVFIDGKLVLDVGGIHQPVTASINFSNDVVKVNGQDDTTIQNMFNKSTASDKTWTKGEEVPHKMRVFYLERGGCDSNLSIRFNMPTTLGKGKLRVIKNDSKIPTTKLANAKFGLYSDPRCENLLTGKEKTSDTDGLLDFGELAFKDVNTTYYLKEISAPEGYLVDTGVYQVKPYVLNGQVQRDSTGNIVLQIIDPNGKSLAQSNPSNLALSSIEFPNEKVSTIDIPAEKKWKDDVVTDSAQITLTIKRYKLVGQTKGLTIEQNLIDKPDSHTFKAEYSITYKKADGEDRTIRVDYKKFSAGRYTITDIEPGTYTVVQRIDSGVPENYIRTDNPNEADEYKKVVELPEDGSVTADFTSTYVQKKGTLNLKAVVSNMPSGVSYNGVRYAILDSQGKKVDSATYEEVMNGKDFDLPVGTYSIKAVNLPKDSDAYPVTRTVTKDGVIVENATITVKNVSITDGGRTSVQFNNSYNLPKATNCKWKIVDQYDHNTVYASGNVTDSSGNWFNEGQAVRLSFSLDTNKYYGSLHRVTYLGQNVSSSDDGTNGNRHRYHVDFNAVKDGELVVEVNRNKGTDANGFVIDSSITATRSRSMSRALNASKGKNRASAEENTEEIHETNPLDAHTVTDPDTQEQINVPASLPEAPYYKKYVKDNEWQKTIVLNKDNTPDAWKDTLKNLEACDVDGNPYYYYVAAVDETGLEKVTTVSFGNNGDELLLIGKDNLDGNTLNVTNTVKRQGALALTKIVTLNGKDSTTNMTDGDYTFTIEGKEGTGTAGITHNVTIHFTSGRATSYIVDGRQVDCKGTDNSWTVILQDLTAGDYVITESQMSNEKMVLTSVAGGKGDGNKDTKKVTVTVHPGDEEPDNEDAKAAFTNDRTEKVTIKVKKVWSPAPLDSENPSITVKLHRYAKKTKGTINITLKDTMQSDPNHVSAPIENAVFRLYEADSPDGPWTETSTTAATDVNGNASVSMLEPGKSYKLVQISTPQRYRYDNDNPPESAVLTVQDNSLAIQEVSTNLTNEALVTSATVTLTLTESSLGSGETDNKIDGAKFKLYKDGILYRTEEYVTADGGKISVSGLPAGDYYFVQTSTTKPYRMPADPKTSGFTVEDAPWKNQSNLSQSMTNDLKGKGTITVTLKKDNANGDPISGAEFQLKKGDDFIDSATTDDDGIATFRNVYEGDYTVHQVNAGSAANDGYEIDLQDKPVSIETNSDTNQSPDPVAFVNESKRGNVTVRLWLNQGQNNYNWWKVSDIINNATFEYPYLKAGETYSFTTVFDGGMYPNNIWTYWDTGDEFSDEGQDGNHPYHKYGHTLVTNNIGSLEESNYNGGTYNFTFTIPENAEEGTIYNLAMITAWDISNISSFAMNQTRNLMLNAAAPQSEPGLFFSMMQKAGRYAFNRALSSPAALKNAPAVTEAQPNKPSSADYFHDEGFCEVEGKLITAVINKDTNDGSWTYEFPAQDKYDPNGEPYYYYVEEIDSTPDEYVITSYAGDPVSDVDTGNITITNTRPQYGALKLTKAVTVNGAAPNNSQEWAMVTGDYTFVVKNSEQVEMKRITLHVDSTGVSLKAPTNDPDVTLADGVLTIAKLPKDTYTVEEAAPANSTALTNVSVSNSGSVENKVATVEVKDKNEQTTIPFVTFTNNINTGNLNLKKQVAGEGADAEKTFEFTIQLTAPNGQSLADSYTFKKNGSTAEGITYTRDANDTAKAAVTGIALKHNDVFTIEDLPEGTTYVIIEEDYSSQGYSSSIPAEGLKGLLSDTTVEAPVTVTNTLSAGNLTVEKTIEGNAADANKDFDFTVSFHKAGQNGKAGSYKIGTTESIETADPVDITFASGEASVTFTLKGGQKAEFTNLPVGTTFTVNETSKDADGYETIVSSTGGTVNADKTVTGSITAAAAVTASYVNKKDTTSAEAVKEWKSGEQIITWPADVEKVEFSLFAKIGEAAPKAVNDDEIKNLFKDIEAVKDVTKDTDDHKASWTNLPARVLMPAVEADPENGIEAKPAEWKSVTYSVRETKIVYKDNTEKVVDAGASNGIITNEIEKVQIHAAKIWKNKNGDVLDGTAGKTIPDGAQVTFTLVKDGVEDSAHTVVLDGVDETSAGTVKPENTDYEGVGWTAWFTELPKYKPDGTLIRYSVKETAKWTGYELEGLDTVGDGNSIINKESSTNIHILKKEKDTDKPLTGAKFVLKRYSDNNYQNLEETWDEQEVSSEEGKKGTLTFEKLQIGYYELEETVPPAGYVKTNANPRFTVTVGQDDNLVVNFENSGLVTYSADNKTFTVENEPGEALPSTGGPGTWYYLLLGGILSVFAGFLLRNRRLKPRWKH